MDDLDKPVIAQVLLLFDFVVLLPMSVRQPIADKLPVGPNRLAAPSSPQCEPALDR